MDKQIAIKLAGGSISKVAANIGITRQAVSQWPDVLPPATRDRVQAVQWRKAQNKIAKQVGAK